MLRLFARRQRASMSEDFTNSLTPPSGLGLLASAPRQESPRSGSAWLGRSQKDGLPSLPGGVVSQRGSRPSTRAQRRGQPGRCPFLKMGVTTLILKRAPIGSNQEDYALMPHFAR